MGKRYARELSAKQLAAVDRILKTRAPKEQVYYYHKLLLPICFPSQDITVSDSGTQLNTKVVPSYQRKLGDLICEMSGPGHVYGHDGRPRFLGVPYGITARLILLWLCKQAKRNDSRVVPLPSSYKEFCESLGLSYTTRMLASIREQFDRLVNCSVRLYRFADDDSFDSGDGRRIDIRQKLDPGQEMTAIWSEEYNSTIDRSQFVLNADFFETLKGAYPIDIRAVHFLRSKNSSVRIDLYLWLCWYAVWMGPAGRRDVDWLDLFQQLGVGYSPTSEGMKNFKKVIRHSLLLIQAIWPSLNFETSSSGITLFKASPHVPSKNDPRPINEQLF